MVFRIRPADRQCVVIGALALFGCATTVHAQVVSQGRGQLTFMVGQGSAPAGGTATDVVAQERVGPETDLKHLGFRVVGGYQFADYVSAEAGVTHLGPFRARAAYLGTDQLLAETALTAIEANLVGKIPVAPVARVDLTLGIVAERLETQLSTVYGSTLPVGQQTPVDAHHFGVTLGADLEWRLTEHTSLIAGYHAYPGVGSSRLVGSANGILSLFGGGVHFEF
jgi:hypothetical protein